jgi:hypothetical protein
MKLFVILLAFASAPAKADVNQTAHEALFLNCGLLHTTLSGAILSLPSRTDQTICYDLGQVAGLGLNLANVAFFLHSDTSDSASQIDEEIGKLRTQYCTGAASIDRVALKVDLEAKLNAVKVLLRKIQTETVR